MKINYLICMGILFGSSVLIAREVRTPLTLQSTFGRVYSHYPVPRPKEDDTCWNIDFIGAAFTRAADRGFTNKDSSKTEPLSGIFFGTPDFTASQIFAPASVNTPNPVLAVNPFINIATISPRFDYNEKGAWFHMTVDRAFCGGRWHVGTRINLPFRYIKTQLDSCCDLEEGGLENVRKLYLEHDINNEGDPKLNPNETIFAYRLDFLSQLVTTENAPFEALVNYQNHTIFGKTIDGTGSPYTYPVHVIYRADGSVPPAPAGLRWDRSSGPANPIPVQNITDLNGNGSGTFTDVQDVNHSLRARFGTSVDYAPLSTNKANQRTLWVVPSIVTDPTSKDTSMASPSRDIETAVERIIQTINTSSVGFLNDQGVSFDTQRSVGLGDLDWDFYAHREWCNECWGYYYLEGLVGVRFPTGKKVKNPLQLLRMPTGNNGHYEVRAGLQGGWEPLDWLNIKADATYSYAIRRTEKVAAPFAGATVKNIGPVIDAGISWGYFLGNIDFTFLVPCTLFPVGVDIGYNVYVKQHDSVKLKQTTATDFFGITQPLNADLLESRTKVVAHRIKTEAFYQGNSWELFGGWSHVVAGKNTTRDTDWYLGLAVFF